MRQFDAAKISSRQGDISKDRTLEARSKELEEVNYKNTSVYVVQSFRQINNSDSEDLDEDPEEDPIDDPEVEPEEDSDKETQERRVESSEADSQDDQKDDLSEEPDSGCENTSDEIKKCISEKNVKQVVNIEYADADQHNKTRMHEVVVDENSKKQETAHNSLKRRRSRWDQDPEEDRDAVKADIKGKKRKMRWDADNPQLRFQEPLQLANLGKGSGSLVGLKVQALKTRLSEVKSKLRSLENKLRLSKPQVKRHRKLIKESDWIIQELVKRNETFEILPKGKSRKLYIPVKEYPAYNFVGLILGPRGNTQKRMEMETGARIRLRGKGANKTSQEADPSDDEDLHVLVEASSQDSLNAAVYMVEKLLIPLEEGKNHHKRAQLVEFGLLKKANLVNSCSICKEPGHNHYACPQKSSTLKAACDTCGSFSHPTSGCHQSSYYSKTKYSKEISASNLYVGHLPPTIDDKRLRDLFSPFGTITQSRVVTDHITGHSKGYGFVRFDTPSAVSLAITHMNGCQTDGHKLAVRIAGVPPAVESPATSFLPVYPGPVATVSRSSVLPHYMLPEAKVSTSLNLEYNVGTGAAVIPPAVSVSTESRTACVSSGTVSMFSGDGGLGFPPTSLNMEYSRQYPQTGAAVIPPVVSGSTESRTASASTGSVSMFCGGAGLGFPSTSLNMQYNRQYPQTGAAVLPSVVSGSTQLRTACVSTGTVSMFSDDGGLGFPPTSLNMVYSHQYPQNGAAVIRPVISGSTELRTACVSTGAGLGFPPTSLNMEYSHQYPQNRAAVIPPVISGSTESRTASASTGSLSMFPGSRGLGFPPTLLNKECNRQYPQTGAAVVPPVVSGSTELRTAFAATSSGSLFLGDPDYPGSGFNSYFTT